MWEKQTDRQWKWRVGSVFCESNGKFQKEYLDYFFTLTMWTFFKLQEGKKWLKINTDRGAGKKLEHGSTLSFNIQFLDFRKSDLL